MIYKYDKLKYKGYGFELICDYWHNYNEIMRLYYEKLTFNLKIMFEN